VFSLPGELQELTDSCPPQQFAQALINVALTGQAPIRRFSMSG
jgi:hypothetical protein